MITIQPANFPYQFSNPELLSRVLKGQGDDFRQLEWLGDRALGLAIVELMRKYVSERKLEEMSRAYGNLTSNQFLIKVGLEIELVRSATSEKDRNQLADTVEALIGAVYLDGGIDAARTCVDKLYRHHLLNADAPVWQRDAKTGLKEYCEGHGLGEPVYSTLRDKDGFLVSCTVGQVSERCRGKKVKPAQTEAAQEVLDQLMQDE